MRLEDSPLKKEVISNRERIVFTLPVLTYFTCVCNMQIVLQMDLLGFLLQDLWGGDILRGWPTLPGKCELDSPKGSGTPTESFLLLLLELPRIKRKYSHYSVVETSLKPDLGFQNIPLQSMWIKEFFFLHKIFIGVSSKFTNSSL